MGKFTWTLAMLAVGGLVAVGLGVESPEPARPLPERLGTVANYGPTHPELGGVMSQRDFPCHEDEVLGYASAFGTEDVGCIQREGRDGMRLEAPRVVEPTSHGKRARRLGFDPSDSSVPPRAVTRYIARNPAEFKVNGWHHFSRAKIWRGCVRHIGETTFVVCKDGRVYSS